MDKKDLLTIEIQLLSIAITLVLGSGAGVGFVYYTNDLAQNLISQIALIVLILVLTISCVWALGTF
ncbi:MAG: hypothetical protein SFY32_02810 [Bacteroidota bacterium]|nr:hypothetical protein [Bacteroidota bacterium]